MAGERQRCDKTMTDADCTCRLRRAYGSGRTSGPRIHRTTRKNTENTMREKDRLAPVRQTDSWAVHRPRAFRPDLRFFALSRRRV